MTVRGNVLIRSVHMELVKGLTLTGTTPFIIPVWPAGAKDNQRWAMPATCNDCWLGFLFIFHLAGAHESRGQPPLQAPGYPYPMQATWRTRRAHGQTGQTNGACIPWLVSVLADAKAKGKGSGKPSRGHCRRHENWRLPNINKKRR